MNKYTVALIAAGVGYYFGKYGCPWAQGLAGMQPPVVLSPLVAMSGDSFQRVVKVKIPNWERA